MSKENEILDLRIRITREKLQNTIYTFIVARGSFASFAGSMHGEASIQAKTNDKHFPILLLFFPAILASGILLSLSKPGAIDVSALSPYWS